MYQTYLLVLSKRCKKETSVIRPYVVRTGLILKSVCIIVVHTTLGFNSWIVLMYGITAIVQYRASCRRVYVLQCYT